MIWIAGTLIALLAVAGMAAPWWWPAFAQKASLRRRAANVAAYRGRLQEIEADVGAGILAPDAVESARAELAARLMADVDAPAGPELEAKSSRGMLAVVALGLIAFAGTWYAVAGTWRTQALVELAKTSPELARSAAVDDMIARLREKVMDRPNDAESWAWLGRSYRDRGNHIESAAAFARASEIKGRQDPDLLVEEGEALAFARDRAMAGEPAARFAQALALAPDHPQALWYAGVAALQLGDDRGAIAHWERLVKQPLPEDTRATLEHSLSRLRERSGIAAPQAQAQARAQAPSPSAAPAGVALAVTVSVAPELAPEVQSGDTLFVYALDTSGSRMPLAIRKLSAGALPLQTTLDDSNSMMEARKLSSVERWRVVARISRSGSAAGQPGDLEGMVEVDREAAARPVRVVINSRRS